MASPVEEVVGPTYKPFIRFAIAAGAIFTVISISSDRAKAFVDERVETRVKVLDNSVADQGRRIERMESKLDAVHDDVTEIKASIGVVKSMLRQKEK